MDQEIGLRIFDTLQVFLNFCLTRYYLHADRTNLAFAALQLNKSLGFSEKLYGLGSSIFFIGYSALQIPSNVSVPSHPMQAVSNRILSVEIILFVMPQIMS